VDEMKATIEIKMDNAAFNESGWDVELVRILRELCDKIERDAREESKLYDVNGNRVGEFVVRGMVTRGERI
jgi:hypothetical protein